MLAHASRLHLKVIVEGTDEMWLSKREVRWSATQTPPSDFSLCRGQVF